MTAHITLRRWSDAPAHHGIWRIGLNRPDKLNALTLQMWAQLHDAARTLAARSDVRCAVIEGEGGAFCAGGDIAQYPAFRFAPETLAHFHETQVWGALQALLDCPFPLIASIQGPCMGAGVEIASCCDLRIAAHGATFGAPIAKLGFPMAPKELELVGREVGAMVARRMLLEAATFSAEDMTQQGFIGQLVAPAVLADATTRTAERVAQLSPLAARLNKQAMRAIAQGGAQAVPDPYAYAAHPEHREGIDAFLAKRKPQFSG